MIVLRSGYKGMGPSEEGRLPLRDFAGGTVPVDNLRVVEAGTHHRAGFVSDLLRKIGKALTLLPTPRYRRALRFGVAAAIEHRAALSVLGGTRFRTIVDIGANRGQFALFALENFPEARLHCFEPVQEAGGRLRRWAGAEARLVLHPLALADREGEADLLVSGRDDNSSLHEPTDRQTDLFPGTGIIGSQTVRVATLRSVLDAAAMERPALLKIDVQGGERGVLAGCGPLLECFDAILVECSFAELYRGQAPASAVVAMLAEASFVPSGVWNLLRDEAGEPVQADLTFRRKGT